MEDKIQELLQSLSRALSQNAIKDVYKYHRLLFDIGESVIPHIKEQILSQSWGEIKYGAQLNLLSGLLSLVNDINEKAAKEIGDEIEQRGCDKVVSTRIQSILDFTLNEFESYEIFDTRIYQSKSLSESGLIKKKMAQWLSMVPGNDLDEVDRIYIIPSSRHDHRGTYTPILCSIMVEWIMPLRYLYPLPWLFLLEIEKTLYHEIGHHVHRHTFGQIPEQEKEANEYSARIFAKSHPKLSKLWW